MSVSSGAMALLVSAARLQSTRWNPVIWNFSVGYAKSAEEKLGIIKPKKPVTAFLKFANQVRPTLLAKNPGTSAVGIIKLASKHWQQLGDDAKEKLTKEYEKDIEAYKKTLASYESALSDEQKNNIKQMEYDMAAAKEKKKMKAEVRELGKPKRPMSSYLLFLQNEKESIKDIGFIEYQIKMKEKWYNLAQSEKSVWEKKADDLKTAYRKELTKWEEKMIKMGHLDFVRNRSPASAKKTKQPSA